MSDPDDGPWDAATVHDDPYAADDDVDDDDDASMEGEDQPTMRATTAQRKAIRDARIARTLANAAAAAQRPAAAGSTTRPPPLSPDRLPASPIGTSPPPSSDRAAPSSDRAAPSSDRAAPRARVPSDRIAAQSPTMTPPGRVTTKSVSTPPPVSERGAPRARVPSDRIAAQSPPTTPSTRVTTKSLSTPPPMPSARSARVSSPPPLPSEEQRSTAPGMTAVTPRAPTPPPDEVRRVTAPGMTAATPRTPTPPPDDAGSTALGMSASKLRAPTPIPDDVSSAASASTPRATASGMSAAEPRAPGAPAFTDPRGAVPEHARRVTTSGISAAMPRAPAAADEVVLLDRVSANAPLDEPPRRTEAAAGGLVVVATGSDGERVRRICHTQGLLVPVMSSLSIVHEAVSVLVIGEPSPPAPERVVHVARPTLSDDQLLVLLRALVGGHTIVEPRPASDDDDAAVRAAADRLATLDDRAAIEAAAIDALKTLTGADRAHCLFHDPSTGALWSEQLRATAGDDRRAMGGLAGWAACTGEAIHASPAGDDPRWLREVDDPDGKAQSRVIVQPVISIDRRVHAVLVAVRRWRHAGFTPQQIDSVARFAARIALKLDLVASSSPHRRRTKPRTATPPAPMPPAMPATKAPMATPPIALLAPKPPARTPSPMPALSAVASDLAPDPHSPTSSARWPTRTRPPSDQPRTTRAPTSPPRYVRPPTSPDAPKKRVAVVAGPTEIDRVETIADKIRIDLSVVATTDAAPADAAIVLLGQAWSPGADPRVAYVARATIGDDDLANLLVALAIGRGVLGPVELAKPGSAAEARRAQIALDGSRTFAAATELGAAETAAVATVRELVDADRAYCLWFDDEAGTLRSPSRKRDERKAIAGVAGWAARTGCAARVDRASADARWLGPIDDPDGDPNSQLAVQPIVRADRRVLGVLVAVRRARRPGFSELDVALLARFAALLAPLVDQLALRVETQRLLGDTTGTAAPIASSPVQQLLARAGNLPRWAYAAGGGVLVLLIVLAARC